VKSKIALFSLLLNFIFLLPSNISTSNAADCTVEYNALDAAERGEAGPNVAGGTRKNRRKRGSKKWGGKSRRTRKNRRSRRRR
jgi:hypothetical protein